MKFTETLFNILKTIFVILVTADKLEVHSSVASVLA